MSPFESKARKQHIVLIAAMLFLLSPAHAEVYKYEDANGNIVFTDEPPADVDSEIVELPPYDPPSKPSLIGRVKRTAPARQNDDPVQKQRTEGLVQEQRLALDRRCKEARVALEVLHQGMPVYWVREGEYRAAWSGDTYDGRRVYLSDAERDAAIDGQLRKLAQNCADPLNEEQQDQTAKDWVKSEKCIAARADLELFLQPKSRAPADFIKQKQEIVDQYCGD